MGLNQNGNLTTWSMTTGRYLFKATMPKLEEKQKKESKKQQIQVTVRPEGEEAVDWTKWRIYKANDKDQTYMKELTSKHQLLYCEDEETVDLNGKVLDRTFFHPNVRHKDIDQMESYIISLRKTFHKFKVIEIKSPTEVEVHMTFIWPIFHDMEQKLYIG